jgi:hypothetical protein
LEVTANFLPQALGVLFGLMLQFDFEEEVCNAHVPVPNFYTKGMACAICQTRRPRRYCPGVNGEICSICCGTEREVSVNCPLDCPYLQEARRHDKPVPIEEDQIPNRDIRVTEDFVTSHEELIAAVGHTLLGSALSTPGVVDFDVRDALAALIRTYRTLESGLYYESLPDNAVAAQVFRQVQEGVAALRRQETEGVGVARTRDADVLGTLVFFQRLELDRNNGRRRGRAFLDLLRAFYAESSGGPEAGSRSLLVG